MRLVQLTPGAGAMYCGNCLRDNALVHALRQQGHDVTMVPLYLPLTLDEADESAGTPIFYGGINVYLEQRSALFRHFPPLVRRWLANPKLLKWAGKRSGNVNPTKLGDLTLSMFRGEQGFQARDLQELVRWLESQPTPDVICLSNALLLGMAPSLRSRFRARLVCQLQGEDAFLDHLSEPQRSQCWEAASRLAADVDLFVAPSRFFAGLMGSRLGIPASRLTVVQNGISLDGYGAGQPSQPQVIGFLARLCPEKGLDFLVDAFIQLRKRGRTGNTQLRAMGYCGPGEAPFVHGLKQRLDDAGLGTSASFHFNPDRDEKIALLKTFTCCSVPVRALEAFGLYVLESLATGVPVVMPQTGGLPELVQDTGGGIIYEAGNLNALTDALESLLLQPARARGLGEAGKQAVSERYTAAAMANRTIQALS